MGVKLAVIIVNYNVKYFLKQCLESVYNSTHLDKIEVYVVDNDSKDGSVEMVANSFPEVKIIANKKNVGFSTANNQAIKQTEAEYVVLLNPDTLIQSDSFDKVIRFMDEHPDAGGLGVKMIDGNGKFLPESKRGLPTPEVAFYKIFGFSKIFPKSRKYGKYHLGFLDQNETHKIEVLSGAFMAMRMETLNKVGLLDEDFFMYGEDIDLSYRIKKGGYENYYYPGTTIIHYKGESTKKSSVNYVYVFYKAMAIFAKKHFESSKASLFSKLIKIAIFFSASLALIKRFFSVFFLPIIDFCTVFFGLHVVKTIYQDDHGLFHQPQLINISFAVYSVLILIAVFFSGGYDRPIKLQKVIKGVALGSLLASLVYVFVASNYYFSMGSALLGILLIMFGLTGVRWILHFFKIKKYRINFFRKRIVIIGDQKESDKVNNLVEHTQLYSSIVGTISPSSTNNEEFLGELKELKKLKEKHRINEAIFCAENMNYDTVIQTLIDFQDTDIQFKLAHTKDMFVLGSTDLNTSGELHIIKVLGIESIENRRLKRLVDISFSIKCFVLIPILIPFQNNKFKFISNVWSVLKGEKSWVGYSSGDVSSDLPKIKEGILSLNDITTSTINRKRLDRVYAKDYSLWTDFTILRKNLTQLGR